MKKVRILCFLLAVCLLLGAVGCEPISVRKVAKATKKAEVTATPSGGETAGPGETAESGETTVPGGDVTNEPYNPSETGETDEPGYVTETPYYPVETPAPLTTDKPIPVETNNPYPVLTGKPIPRKTETAAPTNTPAPKTTGSTKTSSPAKTSATAQPTATPRPTPPVVTYDTDCYIARDYVRVNQELDMVEPGHGVDNASYTLGSYSGKKLGLWGWYATSKGTITSFGYSIDNGAINYSTNFVMEAPDGATDLAKEFCTVKDIAYFDINPIIPDAKSHKYEVFAKVGNDNVHLWTVYGLAVGETEYVDPNPTAAPKTSTPVKTTAASKTATPKPATATPKVTAKPNPPVITYDTNCYIARDYVRVNSSVDMVEPGHGEDYARYEIGNYSGKKLGIWGWYATTKGSISSFGYSIDDGAINYSTNYMIAVSNEAKSMAQEQLGSVSGIAYFDINPIIPDAKSHKYEVFAKVGTQNIHLWTVYGLAVGDTKYVDPNPPVTPKVTPAPTIKTNYVPAQIFTCPSELNLVAGKTATLSYSKASSCSYTSSNTGVASVAANGVVTAKAKGKAIITMTASYGGTTYYYTVQVNVSAAPSTAIRGTNYFDVSYATTSYTYVGSSIKLNCSYINGSGQRVTGITWKSGNTAVATVDSNGNVTGVKAGTAQITATCGSVGKSFTFEVTVLPTSLSSAAKFVVDNHNSNLEVTYNLDIGGDYYYDVVNTINNFFAKPLQIDNRYAGKLGAGTVNVKNDGLFSKCEYVTVHYTGNFAETADADNNAEYFTNAMDYQASIHYVTGRSNLSGSWGADKYYAFSSLDTKYQGWHAGSNGTLSDNSLVWLKTDIPVVDPSKDAVVSISRNGKFTVNGFETSISVPPEVVSAGNLYMTGPTYTYNGTTYDTFNKQGIGWKAEGGYYYITKTYWHDWYYNLSNIGGNTASVGIESCVDKGSNLVHTWHVTAQLVAKLLIEKGLPTSRVVGHHFFSGKDCPQPLLENDAYLWKNMFMKYVKAEYAYSTNYSGYNISYSIVNNGGGCIDSYGLVTQNSEPHLVTYKVTVTKGSTTETFNLSSVIESNKKRPSYASGHESLQQLGVTIR